MIGEKFNKKKIFEGELDVLPVSVVSVPFLKRIRGRGIEVEGQRHHHC